MSNKKYEIDMSQGSIFKNIIRFVIPLILGNMLQLLYNAADIIVVSRWSGSDAMASVGATGSLNALIVNVCIGIAVGASVTVSKKYGARNTEGVHRAVHSAMLIGIILGVLAMIFGVVFARPLLRLMATPEGKVLDGAVVYMTIYFLAVPALMTYNFGASILRAIGDTKRPLYILAVTGLVNIVLNLIFVVFFHMGVAGVAIATGVANYLSAAAVVMALVRTDGAYKLFIKKMRFYKEECKEIFTVGLPAGLQSSVFSLANSVIQSAVNSFGTAAIAGSAAGSNIEGFVYTAMNAFYQGTLTAVSQNYGNKDEKRVKKSIWTSVASVAVVGIVLGSLTAIFARPLLNIYITDSPEALEYGVIRIFYIGIPYFLCGIMDVLSGALRGLGYSTISAINSLVGACGLRMLWVAFVLPHNRTIQTLFTCWPVSWVIVILMHLVCYMFVRKKWVKKMNAA
ncbi:MAG: MATE family efflux transporter [Ruminococcaceae bacterium]|nr:MATE family efflux transporter [Oscillospiraceae bacterium]